MSPAGGSAAENGRMECPLCGYAFRLQEAAALGCRLCPLHDGCGAISCPNCGYCQPSTAKIEGRLRRLVRWLKGETPAPETASAPPGWTCLRDLAVGARARVVAIGGHSSRSAARLGGFCILPGAVIELLQRKPAFVVRVEETTVALESRLASGIWVQAFLPDEEALSAMPKR